MRLFLRCGQSLTMIMRSPLSDKGLVLNKEIVMRLALIMLFTIIILMIDYYAALALGVDGFPTPWPVLVPLFLSVPIAIIQDFNELTR